MYERILLAYDGSVEGRTALREGGLPARQLSRLRAFSLEAAGLARVAVNHAREKRG
jgi:hypothetical protein